MPIVVEWARHLAVARDLDAEQPSDVQVRRDREQRVIAAMLDGHDSRSLGSRRVGERSDDVFRADAPLDVEPDRRATAVGGSCSWESVDGTRRIRAASADAGSAPSACARRRFARSTSSARRGAFSGQ